MHKVEVRGPLKVGATLEILYNFDLRAEVTAGTVKAEPVPPVVDDKGVSTPAEPATLLAASAWTDPEKALFRAGEIVQYKETWSPKRQVWRDPDTKVEVPKGTANAVKDYEPVDRIADLKVLLAARYDQIRADEVVRNQRRHEGMVTAFLKANDTWGTE